MTQNLARSGNIPTGANPEEMKKNPELFLDLTRPFGHIMGVTMAPARFEQDGKFFNQQGKLIEKPHRL